MWHTEQQPTKLCSRRNHFKIYIDLRKATDCHTFYPSTICQKKKHTDYCEVKKVNGYCGTTLFSLSVINVNYFRQSLIYHDTTVNRQLTDLVALLTGPVISLQSKGIVQVFGFVIYLSSRRRLQPAFPFYTKCLSFDIVTTTSRKDKQLATAKPAYGSCGTCNE